MELDQDFKDALGSWASGVSVVAIRDGQGRVYGLTVSSFASVSLHPPLVLVCLTNVNRLPSMITQQGAFTVSILAEGQEEASGYFASRGREPSAEIPIALAETPSGQPIVAGCAAWVDCTLHEAHVVGDHTIVVGQVSSSAAHPETAPLVYFRRAYRSVSGD